ncbi:hypothetical protein ABHC48_12650 [Ruminococcus sp. 1001136sp1]|uniref:hypothetical protein n=1 Tax=Ruminococcus sp. 1001136sp1 TaxID=2986996 RepID=UPI00325B9F8B
MGKESFTLTEKEEREIKELLKLADKSLSTDKAILFDEKGYNEVLGYDAINSRRIDDRELVKVEAVPSGLGKILSIFGGAAVTESIGTGAAASFATGAGITMGTIVLPVGIAAFLGGITVGAVAHSIASKKDPESKRKTANYCKEFSEKMNEINKKHEQKIKEMEERHIKDQKEIYEDKKKIAEYEAIYAAMRKKYGPMADLF